MWDRSVPKMFKGIGDDGDGDFVSTEETNDATHATERAPVFRGREWVVWVEDHFRGDF